MNMQKEYKLIFSDNGVKKEEMTKEEIDKLIELNKEVELQLRTEKALIGLKKCTEYCCGECPYGEHSAPGYTLLCMDKLMKDLYDILQEHGVYDQFARRLSAIEQLNEACEELQSYDYKVNLKSCHYDTDDYKSADDWEYCPCCGEQIDWSDVYE